MSDLIIYMTTILSILIIGGGYIGYLIKEEFEAIEDTRYKKEF